MTPPGHTAQPQFIQPPVASGSCQPLLRRLPKLTVRAFTASGQHNQYTRRTVSIFALADLRRVRRTSTHLGSSEELIPASIMVQTGFKFHSMHRDLRSRPVEMEETDADDPQPLLPTQPASEPATRLRFRLSSLIHPGEQSI